MGWLIGAVSTLAGIPLLLLSVLAAALPGAGVAVGLGPGVPAQYAQAILAAAADCDPPLPANVLAAQLHQESGWNPDALSPAGAIGLAQFMPATWAGWGRDADHDGSADPRNPLDAIATEGAFMCALYRQFHTDIELALAAYNAGPGAVQRYNGVPPYPETRAYVRAVLALAGTDDYALIYPTSYHGQPVDALMPAGRHNPRDADAAVRWALAQVGKTVLPDGTAQAGHCLRLVTLAYGHTAGKAYAYQVWTDAPASIRHPGDRNPPPGAVLVWDNNGIGCSTSGTCAGHIAIALGNGQMVTTTGSTVQTMPINAYVEMSHYYGWMPPLIT